MQEGCLLDSNILLRLLWLKDFDSQAVESAITFLLKSERPLYFSLQNASECWNVCTRPVRANGLGLTPEQTSGGLRVLGRQLIFLPETTAVYDRWLSLVRDNVVIGKQVHDAKLVALMLTHRVLEILTLNTGDFLRYAGIRAVSPKDVA